MIKERIVGSLKQKAQAGLWHALSYLCAHCVHEEIVDAVDCSKTSTQNLTWEPAVKCSVHS